MLLVRGGPTGAGTRIVRPTPKPWTCKCPVEQKAYMPRCAGCGTVRP